MNPARPGLKSNDQVAALATTAWEERSITVPQTTMSTKWGGDPSTQAVVSPAASEIEITDKQPVEPTTLKLPPKDYKEVCGDAADIDIHSEEQVTGVMLSVEDRLLGKIQHALTESQLQLKPVVVSVKQHPTFLVDASAGKVKTSLTEEMLSRLCGDDLSADAASFKVLDDEESDESWLEISNVDTMLWKIAAWTYQGKLPAGTSFRERVYLRHWPNLTRLLELPDAMRISALLVDQPMLLTGIAEALGIPHRHVFAYFSSANSIGLMGYAKREADYLIEPPPTPPKHVQHNKLGQMIRHLRKLLS
jgi:hypothetical protein